MILDQTLKTPDQVLEELTKARRSPPSDAFLRAARKESWIDQVLDAIDLTAQEEEFGILVERCQYFDGSRRTGSKSLPAVAPRQDPRLGALSLILAAEAKWMPEVVRFRQRILGGKGIPQGQVSRWIKAQLSVQGAPTVHITEAKGSNGAPLRKGEILRIRSLPDFPPTLDLPSLVPSVVFRQLEALQEDPGFSDENALQALSAVEVAHADPNQPGVAWSLRVETLKIAGHPLIPIDIGGVLGTLKNLAQQLSIALGFDEGGWALYLLSHAPPEPNLAVVNIATGPVPALDRVTIQASPLLNSKQLTSLYSEARSTLAKYEKDELYTPYTFDHPISEKHVQLAIFIAQSNNGQTVSEAMDQWNQAHPEFSYETSRHFGRDARAAYRRITGKKLRWRRRAAKARSRKAR